MPSSPTASAKKKWYEHSFWQGAGGAIAAAVIAAVVALFAGNSGVASGVLPGSPEVTVTASGPTITVTPMPVTVAPSPESSVGSDEPPISEVPEVIHLAESDGQPEGILAPNQRVNWETNLAIDGGRFATGWTSPMSSSSSPRVAMGINTNGQYSKFRARIGLSANDSNNHPTRVAILGDDRVLKERTVTLSTHEDLDLAIKDVIRVEIKVYPPEGEGSSVYVAVGDPTIEKNP